MEANTQKSWRRLSQLSAPHLSSAERFQTFTWPMGWALPRSTCHQGLSSLPVCDSEPLSHTPSVLPSTARDASPPHPVELWVAGLLRARLSGRADTVSTASFEVADPVGFVATA